MHHPHLLPPNHPLGPPHPHHHAHAPPPPPPHGILGPPPCPPPPGPSGYYGQSGLAVSSSAVPSLSASSASPLSLFHHAGTGQGGGGTLVPPPPPPQQPPPHSQQHPPPGGGGGVRVGSGPSNFQPQQQQQHHPGLGSVVHHHPQQQPQQHQQHHHHHPHQHQASLPPSHSYAQHSHPVRAHPPPHGPSRRHPLAHGSAVAGAFSGYSSTSEDPQQPPPVFFSSHPGLFMSGGSGGGHLGSPSGHGTSGYHGEIVTNRRPPPPGLSQMSPPPPLLPPPSYYMPPTALPSRHHPAASPLPRSTAMAHLLGTKSSHRMGGPIAMWGTFGPADNISQSDLSTNTESPSKDHNAPSTDMLLPSHTVERQNDTPRPGGTPDTGTSSLTPGGDSTPGRAWRKPLLTNSVSQGSNQADSLRELGNPGHLHNDEKRLGQERGPSGSSELCSSNIIATTPSFEDPLRLNATFSSPAPPTVSTFVLNPPAPRDLTPLLGSESGGSILGDAEDGEVIENDDSQKCGAFLSQPENVAFQESGSNSGSGDVLSSPLTGTTAAPYTPPFRNGDSSEGHSGTLNGDLVLETPALRQPVGMARTSISSASGVAPPPTAATGSPLFHRQTVEDKVDEDDQISVVSDEEDDDEQDQGSKDGTNGFKTQETLVQERSDENTSSVRESPCFTLWASKVQVRPPQVKPSCQWSSSSAIDHGRNGTHHGINTEEGGNSLGSGSTRVASSANSIPSPETLVFKLSNVDFSPDSPLLRQFTEGFLPVYCYQLDAEAQMSESGAEQPVVRHAEVFLIQSRLVASSLKRILDTLTSLSIYSTALHLGSNPLLGSEGIHVLSDFVRQSREPLRWLSLSKCDITNEALQKLFLAVLDRSDIYPRTHLGVPIPLWLDLGSFTTESATRSLALSTTTPNTITARSDTSSTLPLSPECPASTTALEGSTLCGPSLPCMIERAEITQFLDNIRSQLYCHARNRLICGINRCGTPGALFHLPKLGLPATPSQTLDPVVDKGDSRSILPLQAHVAASPPSPPLFSTPEILITERKNETVPVLLSAIDDNLSVVSSEPGRWEEDVAEMSEIDSIEDEEADDPNLLPSVGLLSKEGTEVLAGISPSSQLTSQISAGEEHPTAGRTAEAIRVTDTPPHAIRIPVQSSSTELFPSRSLTAYAKRTTPFLASPVEEGVNINSSHLPLQAPSEETSEQAPPLNHEKLLKSIYTSLLQDAYLSLALNVADRQIFPFTFFKDMIALFVEEKSPDTISLPHLWSLQHPKDVIAHLLACQLQEPRGYPEDSTRGISAEEWSSSVVDSQPSHLGGLIADECHETTSLGGKSSALDNGEDNHGNEERKRPHYSAMAHQNGVRSRCLSDPPLSTGALRTSNLTESVYPRKRSSRVASMVSATPTHTLKPMRSNSPDSSGATFTLGGRGKKRALNSRKTHVVNDQHGVRIQTSPQQLPQAGYVAPTRQRSGITLGEESLPNSTGVTEEEEEGEIGPNTLSPSSCGPTVETGHPPSQAGATTIIAHHAGELSTGSHSVPLLPASSTGAVSARRGHRHEPTTISYRLPKFHGNTRGSTTNTGHDITLGPGHSIPYDSWSSEKRRRRTENTQSASSQVLVELPSQHQHHNVTATTYGDDSGALSTPLAVDATPSGTREGTEFASSSKFYTAPASCLASFPVAYNASSTSTGPGHDAVSATSGLIPSAATAPTSSVVPGVAPPPNAPVPDGFSPNVSPAAASTLFSRLPLRNRSRPPVFAGAFLSVDEEDDEEEEGEMVAAPTQAPDASSAVSSKRPMPSPQAPSLSPPPAQDDHQDTASSVSHSVLPITTPTSTTRHGKHKQPPQGSHVPSVQNGRIGTNFSLLNSARDASVRPPKTNAAGALLSSSSSVAPPSGPPSLSNSSVSSTAFPSRRSNTSAAAGGSYVLSLTPSTTTPETAPLVYRAASSRSYH